MAFRCRALVLIDSRPLRHAAWSEFHAARKRLDKTAADLRLDDHKFIGCEAIILEAERRIAARNGTASASPDAATG